VLKSFDENSKRVCFKKILWGDKTRKNGQPVKYKINRRGKQYIENVITGKSDD